MIYIGVRTFVHLRTHNAFNSQTNFAHFTFYIEETQNNSYNSILTEQHFKTNQLEFLIHNIKLIILQILIHAIAHDCISSHSYLFLLSRNTI